MDHSDLANGSGVMEFEDDLNFATREDPECFERYKGSSNITFEDDIKVTIKKAPAKARPYVEHCDRDEPLEFVYEDEPEVARRHVEYFKHDINRPEIKYDIDEQDYYHGAVEVIKENDHRFNNRGRESNHDRSFDHTMEHNDQRMEPREDDHDSDYQESRERDFKPMLDDLDCARCVGTGHHEKECRARRMECSQCHLLGHIDEVHHVKDRRFREMIVRTLGVNLWEHEPRERSRDQSSQREEAYANDERKGGNKKEPEEPPLGRKEEFEDRGVNYRFLDCMLNCTRCLRPGHHEKECDVLFKFCKICKIEGHHADIHHVQDEKCRQHIAKSLGFDPWLEDRQRDQTRESSIIDESSGDRVPQKIKLERSRRSIGDKSSGPQSSVDDLQHGTRRSVDEPAIKPRRSSDDLPRRSSNDVRQEEDIRSRIGRPTASVPRRPSGDLQLGSKFNCARCTRPDHTERMCISAFKQCRICKRQGHIDKIHAVKDGSYRQHIAKVLEFNPWISEPGEGFTDPNPSNDLPLQSEFNCARCTRPGHNEKECKGAVKHCRTCGRLGHIYSIHAITNRSYRQYIAKVLGFNPWTEEEDFIGHKIQEDHGQPNMMSGERRRSLLGTAPGGSRGSFDNIPEQHDMISMYNKPRTEDNSKTYEDKVDAFLRENAPYAARALPTRLLPSAELTTPRIPPPSVPLHVAPPYGHIPNPMLVPPPSPYVVPITAPPPIPYVAPLKAPPQQPYVAPIPEISAVAPSFAAPPPKLTKNQIFSSQPEIDPAPGVQAPPVPQGRAVAPPPPIISKKRRIDQEILQYEAKLQKLREEAKKEDVPMFGKKMERKGKLHNQIFNDIYGERFFLQCIIYEY